MARMTVSAEELGTERLERMSREMIRRMVMAGAGAAAERMRQQTAARGHVRTGDMIGSIGSSEYREWYQGGATDVYPLENDRKGVRNATKAYVINYGRGGTRKRNGKMGDKFITGDEKATEEAVAKAMAEENDRMIEEG